MRRALHAEWIKARTMASTGWLLLGAVAATVALSAAATAASAHCRAGGCDPAKTSLTGVQLGQALVAIVAVLAVGGEYGTGMIRVTLAAMPRRMVVLAAKAAVVAGLVLPAGAVAVAASLWAGRLAPWDDGPVLRAAAGSVLYLALIALLALGAATAVRDSAAAIGLVLGLLYVFPILANVVTDAHWQRLLQQIGPMSAGLAIQATTGLASLPIGPWPGLGVLAAWAAAALAAGALVLRLRDA